mgnify:CR=1 FL=1|jgi:hypothetical protein|tara:strand:+ start:398 stop:616 length:219 start_codon:yes stop_codon:yes gene_type:complete
MAKAKQGKIIEIKNKDRKFGANEKYYAIWTENSRKQERCLLFTEHQLLDAGKRAQKNPEDIPKKGFFTDLFD